MRCELMHKNISVAELVIDGKTAAIISCDNVTAPEHLPFGIKGDERSLNEWWHSRAIPASREGIDEALDVLGVDTSKVLLTRCYGLSLSDQYWIKPMGRSLNWKDINFFYNDFSDDIGNILLGEHNNSKALDFISPDNTSDGNLKKRWKIIDGKRCLIKAGAAPLYQAPLNEVIATRIMERLNIPHVLYKVMWRDGLPYSVCENFITPETELVSAWNILKHRGKFNHENDYLHYVNCCKELGIPDIEHSLDMMIVVDYIIANEDRHLRNFGAIRNAETLEWLGAAPIFDSGNSLDYNKLPSRRRIDSTVCKPFKKTHAEQLGLVKSFDWIDFSKLNGIVEEIEDILSAHNAVEIYGPNRHKIIAERVADRIKAVEKAAEKERGCTVFISQSDLNNTDEDDDEFEM